MNIKNWVVLIVATLLLSCFVYQSVEIGNKRDTIYELSSNIDFYANENAMLKSQVQSLEKARRAEIETFEEQLQELASLRDQEFKVLSSLKDLERKDNEVKDFFDVPIPNSLRGVSGVRLKSAS